MQIVLEAAGLGAGGQDQLFQGWLNPCDLVGMCLDVGDDSAPGHDKLLGLGAQTLSGPICISALGDIGRTVMSDVMNRFLSAPPDIRIELVRSDGFIDIVLRCAGLPGALVRQWCLAGDGIILKSELDVGPDIQAGRLVELLAEHAPPATPLQMLFPPGRAQPRRVRALADQLAEGLA